MNSLNLLQGRRPLCRAASFGFSSENAQEDLLAPAIAEAIGAFPRALTRKDQVARDHLPHLGDPPPPGSPRRRGRHCQRHRGPGHRLSPGQDRQGRRPHPCSGPARRLGPRGPHPHPSRPGPSCGSSPSAGPSSSSKMPPRIPIAAFSTGEWFRFRAAGRRSRKGPAASSPLKKCDLGPG